MTIGHIGTATKAESEQEMPATQWGVFCCMCIYMLARTWPDITHSYCKQFLFREKVRTRLFMYTMICFEKYTQRI